MNLDKGYIQCSLYYIYYYNFFKFRIIFQIQSQNKTKTKQKACSSIQGLSLVHHCISRT